MGITNFVGVQTTWTSTCGEQQLMCSFCICPESYFLFLHKLYTKQVYGLAFAGIELIFFSERKLIGTVLWFI